MIKKFCLNKKFFERKIHVLLLLSSWHMVSAAVQGGAIFAEQVFLG